MIKRLAFALVLFAGLTLARAQIGPLPGMAVLPPPSSAAGCAAPVVTNIGTNANTAGATLTLSAVTVPAASLIVVIVAEDDGGAGGGSISDGVNTYTSASLSGIGNVLVGTLHTFFAPNASLSGGTITYTKNTSGDATSITAIYASNILTVSPLDAAVKATATGNSAAPTVTSGTPAQSGELFVGGIGVNGTETFTQDSGHGWSSPPNSSGSTFPAFGGAQVNAGTGTKIFAPTLSASNLWGINVVGFKHC